MWVGAAMLTLITSCTGSVKAEQLPVQRLCGQGVSIESFLPPVKATGQTVTLSYEGTLLIVFTTSCSTGPDIYITPDRLVTTRNVIHGSRHGLIAEQLQTRILHGGTAVITACTTRCHRVLTVKIAPCLPTGESPPRPPTPVACHLRYPTR